MKLSKRTVEILKNFASINPNILVPEGNKLATIGALNTIMATAEIEEKFDKEVGIFNLVEFISVLGLYTDPEITLADRAVTIKQDDSYTKYVYASKDILTYPKKEFKAPDFDVEFEVTATMMDQIQKVAATLGVGDIAFVGEKGKLLVKIMDKKNSSSNQHVIDLKVKTKDTFIAYFKIENFKQVSDDYKVSLSKKLIGSFEGKGSKIKYFIAIEQDSEWS
jgi:hypothetical protein